MQLINRKGVMALFFFILFLLLSWHITPKLFISDFTVDNASTNSLYDRTEEEKIAHLIDPSPKNIALDAKQFADYSYDQKLYQESLLNKIAAKNNGLIHLSGRKIYEMLIAKGVGIDADMAKRMIDDQMIKADWDLYETMIASFATEEQNFQMELTQYNKFSEIKLAFENRSKKTGMFYGNELLAQSQIYSDITPDELLHILASGAVLPDNFIKMLIEQKNIDLAIEIKKRGYSFNANYSDPYQSMNLLELQVLDYRLSPSTTSLSSKIDVIDKILSLGAPAKYYDGTRDALDIALEGALTYNDEESAHHLLELAMALNKRGIELESSHQELLKKINAKYPHYFNGAEFKFN